jgi:hypothetical protein
MSSAIQEANALIRARLNLRDGTGKLVEDIRKQTGLCVLEENGFWGWKFGCNEGVYSAIGFDRLHVLSGLIKNVSSALDCVLGAEAESADPDHITRFINRKKALMDKRFAQCPSYFGGSSVYIPRLTGGFYAKKRAEVSKWPSRAYSDSLIRFRHGITICGCHLYLS